MARGIHTPASLITSPRVKPGEALGFVGRMKDKGVWPPPIGRHSLHPGPTVTPFVVVPVSSADDGTRPFQPADEAFHSAAIDIVDSATGGTVTNPIAGQTYRLRCRLRNLGGAGAYGGILEFYIAQPEDFDNAAASGSRQIPAKGYAGFSTLPMTTSTVDCPNVWIPATDLEAASTVLVHAYDPFIDPLQHPFDAIADRHVGRLNTLPIFSGTWDGSEHAPFPEQPAIPGQPTPVALAFRLRLVIAQNRLDLNVSLFQETHLGGGLPGNPQHVLASRISRSLVVLNYTDSPTVGRLPNAFHQYTLRLTGQTSMRIEHRIHFTADEGIDQVLVGDLARTSG